MNLGIAPHLSALAQAMTQQSGRYDGTNFGSPAASLSGKLSLAAAIPQNS
ncbi:MAG: hypothetical protein ABI162_16430 [Luteolibacter sp.]